MIHAFLFLGLQLAQLIMHKQLASRIVGESTHFLIHRILSKFSAHFSKSFPPG